MVVDKFSPDTLYSSGVCIRFKYSENDVSACDVLLAKEHALTLYVNGQALYNFVCSPAQFAELCIGWLCGEGYIRSVADVKELHISEDGHKVNVILPDIRRRETAAFATYTAPDIILLEKTAHALKKEDNIYTRTRSTHGCAFGARNEPLVFCEDISRYNALDKTIGTVLLRGESLREGIVFSSGRIFAKMVEKVVRSGIPVLASKAAATEDAIAAANRYRQTLLFFADSCSFIQSNVT